MAQRLHHTDTVSDRSSLNRPSDRIDELTAQLERGFSFAPNPAYESYLKMHKVWVGQKGGDYLRGIYESLSQEQLPRYLSAAGWAAVEAAIVQKENPTQLRLDLLYEGVECWERALEMYLAINKQEYKSVLVGHSEPYRVALNLAVVPYLEGLVLGYISDEMSRNAFVDSLEVAKANADQIKLTEAVGDIMGSRDHSGFAHECNAMLAINRMHSQKWFALPTIARADSGHYYPQETHDLLVVHHSDGEIKNVVPVEVKAKASGSDRKRYLALIVRGKLHLCSGQHRDPIDTLEAIAATERKTATREQYLLARRVSSKMMEMVKDYNLGPELGMLATRSTITRFHDRTIVEAKHDSLAKSCA